FLTASVEERAARRHNQLISRGIPANIDSLLSDLRARDERDTNRAVAPLKPAQDAVLLDNSGMSIDEGVDAVLEAWSKRRRMRRTRTPRPVRGGGRSTLTLHPPRVAICRQRSLFSVASRRSSGNSMPKTQPITDFAAGSFAAMFEESLKSSEMRSGEVITAEVVRIDHSFVVVNAGLKSEAYVPIDEFKNDQGEIEVQVGDFVSVAIDAVENGYGDTILSRDKAKRLASW